MSMIKRPLRMYKKLGTTSIATIPMWDGEPLDKQSKQFLEALKLSLKGTNKRVCLKARKPWKRGMSSKWSDVPMFYATEADVYIYNK